MVSLLVHTRDTLGAENYGMALVWISPHQVQSIHNGGGSRDMLSACISSGPNWPYVLAQL